MATDSDIFDSYVCDFGGELHTDGLPDNFLPSLVKSLATAGVEHFRALHPKLPPIYVGLIKNHAINAVAFRDHDRYFVGIYNGAVIGLANLFMRILSDPRFFRHIGDPTKEFLPIDTLRNIKLEYGS